MAMCFIVGQGCKSTKMPITEDRDIYIGPELKKKNITP